MSEIIQKVAGQVVNDVEEFIIDREAMGLSPRTVEWYGYCLKTFVKSMNELGVEYTHEIDASHIRRFLVSMRKEGRSAGGIFDVYSAVRAFFNWYKSEYAPREWENPLDHITAPKRPTEIKEPMKLDVFEALVGTCRGTFEDKRDRAMFYFLVDTGVRKQELADLNVGDIDMESGAVLIRSGKGGKTRQVFFGKQTKKELTKYLRMRRELTQNSPLWITSTGKRITTSGLRQVLRRRAERAGIKEPGFHDFRRTFSINSLRAGMDLITLKRLLGHSDLSVIEKYLALVSDDLRESHAEYAPLDFFLGNNK